MWNGLAYYQNAMQGSFEGCGSDMSKEAGALLTFFMGDGSLGTGSYDQNAASQFDLHLRALSVWFLIEQSVVEPASS